MMIIVSEQRAG